MYITLLYVHLCWLYVGCAMSILGQILPIISITLQPTDTNGYYQSKEDFEPGLNWLNHFISLFISNKYIYQLLLTALFQIPIYIFFKRYSENKFISLFLYTALALDVASTLWDSMQCVNHWLQDCLCGAYWHIWIMAVT